MQYKYRGGYLGPDSLISSFFEGKLTIGKNFSATSKLTITCTDNIIIGDDVLIGSNVTIMDDNHGMDPENGLPYGEQPLITKKVIIKDGVWIGDNVTILPGVVIGKKAIIGAGSIVTHDVEAYTIAAGNPARPIKIWNTKVKKWEKIEYGSGSIRE